MFCSAPAVSSSPTLMYSSASIACVEYTFSLVMAARLMVTDSCTCMSQCQWVALNVLQLLLLHAYVLPLQSLRSSHAGATQDETNMKVWDWTASVKLSAAALWVSLEQSNLCTLVIFRAWLLFLEDICGYALGNGNYDTQKKYITETVQSLHAVILRAWCLDCGHHHTIINHNGTIPSCLRLQQSIWRYTLWKEVYKHTFLKVFFFFFAC